MVYNNQDMPFAGDEIFEGDGLTEGISSEAQLWDEMLKSMVFFMPQQLFPLIKEVFHHEYPEESTIELEQKEYSIRDSEGMLKSIYADIVFHICMLGQEKSNTYHLECQIENDSAITIRMFEYDVQIALSNISKRIKQSAVNKQLIRFPNSAVIYLQHTRNTPACHTCIIEFPDGKQLEYNIPVLKVQLYSVKDIQRKHLNMLIPFLPLRFRSRLESKQDGKKLTKEELTAFLKEVILIIREEEIAHSLSHHDATKLIELLNKSVIRVFHKHEDYLKEVLSVTKPILTFETDKWIVFTEKLKAESKQLENKNNQLRDENSQLEDKNSQLEDKNSQLEDKNSQLEDKNNQLEIEKNQSIQIAKLALRGYDAATIAEEMSIPVSAIQSLLED